MLIKRYGLLGASGCGKTTLLGCILGQKKLNSGQIWVLGGTPGTQLSGVPGRRIGYMPQETALYGSFTIHETFVYFGWIAGMTTKQIQERTEQLTKLLMLPGANQTIDTLSGGEQRRVSFASALLHKPELLILDEPTVGLDPILRESIWKHMLNISKENNTTIIMTTHYIEEVRQAHVVGLMRGGELLAQDSPDKLLLRYGTDTLEEVFLVLSVSQNSNRQPCNIPESAGNFPTSVTAVTSGSDNFELSDIKLSAYMPSLSGFRLKALIWKNALWWKRNIGMLMVALSLSVIVIGMTCSCIGGEPRDLHVAVINYETNNSLDCKTILTCSSEHISCHFFEYLKKSSIRLIYHSSEDDVKKLVLQGDTYASVIVPHNYSAALRSRLDNWQGPAEWDIEYSTIKVFRDASNSLISNYLRARLYDEFQKFAGEYLRSCNINERALRIPIKWEIPVYGLQSPSATDVILPGILVGKEASLERTFAVGISTTELLIAHIVCEATIIALQSILAVITAFVILEQTNKGSITLVLLLVFSTGFLGMCYGIFISCICDSLMTVNALGACSCFPMLLLCGALWPLEGMHHLLRPIAVILPLTKATESMRSILQRNWNLSSDVVLAGFGFNALWTTVFLLLTVMVLKFKKD